MSKNCIGILLYFILLAPVVVYWGWLQYQKAVTKHEVKRSLISGLDKAELTLLKFERSEIATLRFEGSDELEYNGEMYDIVSTENAADTVYYWCWRDDEETRLNNQLTALLEQAFDNHPQNQERQKRLFAYLQGLYHHQQTHWQFTTPTGDKGMFDRYITRYPSINFSPPVPPPRFC